MGPEAYHTRADLERGLKVEHDPATAPLMTRFVRIDGRESIATSQPCDLRTVGEQKGIRHQDKDTVLIASLFGNDGFDLGGFVNRCCNCLHSKGWGSGFEDDQIIFGIWRGA